MALNMIRAPAVLDKGSVTKPRRQIVGMEMETFFRLHSLPPSHTCISFELRNIFELITIFGK